MRLKRVSENGNIKSQQSYMKFYEDPILDENVGFLKTRDNFVYILIFQNSRQLDL